MLIQTSLCVTYVEDTQAIDSCVSKLYKGVDRKFSVYTHSFPREIIVLAGADGEAR